ncbi:MAG: phytanoyl-CoA dioxygenase family protein [Sneathiella sp.]|nr:phytanoyl-CoA dioxygenase family protein [Sneathiella sp.]
MKKDSQLATAGYEVLPCFMPKDECLRIIEDFDHYFQKKLPEDDTDSYIVSRRTTPNYPYDKNVFQLMNYHHLNGALKDQYDDKILSLFKEQLGLDLSIASYTVQLDLADTASKRPFHTDGFQVNFKLFIYLSDVPQKEGGPYTVIPGSHKKYLLKWRNLLGNFLSGNPSPDDMTDGFSDDKSLSITGDAGTAILSCQALAHKGWQEHSGDRRYMLVVYLRAGEREGEHFNLGREMAINAPMQLYSAK